jgi:restriction system protein
VVAPEPGHLVVNREVPLPAVLPDKVSYRYVKTRDEIDETDLSPTKQKSLYTKILAQMALRSILEVLEADRSRKLTEVTFNGYVPGHDPATGLSTKLVLASFRARRRGEVHYRCRDRSPTNC